MIIKFRVVYEDGTYLDSHENWQEVADHGHALPPVTDKKWLEYQLISDDGRYVAVNFSTGIFNINGQIIHPADEGGGSLTNRTDVQSFEAAYPWNSLNGMPYFPVVGRRSFYGDFGEAKAYFCGWKRKEDDKTVEKLCFFFGNVSNWQPQFKDVMYPGAILLT